MTQGGEAAVFRIEHSDQDEIVAKIPLFEETSTSYDNAIQYMSMLYESQTLKLNPYKENIARIKEEIIEINAKAGLITMYIVIVEKRNTHYMILSKYGQTRMHQSNTKTFIHQRSYRIISTRRC